MAFKVSKSVHKVLGELRGQTLIFQSREQLADKMCQSCNCSGGGVELWLKVIGFVERKGAVVIEDVTELNGRKVTQINVTFADMALRLTREERRELDGYKKRVEVNKTPRYVQRPMKVVA